MTTALYCADCPRPRQLVPVAQLVEGKDGLYRCVRHAGEVKS